MADENPQIRVSPVAKALNAFVWYRENDGEGGSLRSEAFRVGLASELKELRNRVLLLFVVTAIISFVLLGGGVPDQASVSILGTSIPVSKISFQALAVMNAALFGSYATAFLSFWIATQMFARLHIRQEREHWQFYGADIFAEPLWATAMHGDDFAFIAPAATKMFAVVILIISLGSVALHAIVVLAASGVSLAKALQAGPFEILLGVAACAFVAVSIVAVITAIGVKMRYRSRS